MVRANLTKAKINEGQVALGASINFYAPGLVELYGVMGFGLGMDRLRTRLLQRLGNGKHGAGR